MKIAVIGFGAAAIGFIERMKDEGHEIVVFEKPHSLGMSERRFLISGNQLN